MDKNLYVPPKSRVTDPAGEQIAPRRTGALLWRVVFLLAFAAINFYFARPTPGQFAYLLMGFLCLGSAILLIRLSRWAQYPLYLATLIMGGGVIAGVVYAVQNPELIHQLSLERQIISWAIPVVPTALLVACCTFARKLARGFQPTLESTVTDRKSEL